MTPKQRRTVAAATAKLVGGPYSVERGLDTAQVLRGGASFKDAFGRSIDFSVVDAEKIVRLFNLDALDGTGR